MMMVCTHRLTWGKGITSLGPFGLSEVELSGSNKEMVLKTQGNNDSIGSYQVTHGGTHSDPRIRAKREQRFRFYTERFKNRDGAQQTVLWYGAHETAMMTVI